MEIVVAILMSLPLLAVIIASMAFGLKMLGQMIQVDTIAYIDEETEDYINSPNRWD